MHQYVYMYVSLDMYKYVLNISKHYVNNNIYVWSVSLPNSTEGKKWFLEAQRVEVVEG